MTRIQSLLAKRYHHHNPRSDVTKCPRVLGLFYQCLIYKINMICWADHGMAGSPVSMSADVRSCPVILHTHFLPLSNVCSHDGLKITKPAKLSSSKLGPHPTPFCRHVGSQDSGFGNEIIFCESDPGSGYTEPVVRWYQDITVLLARHRVSEVIKVNLSHWEPLSLGKTLTKDKNEKREQKMFSDWIHIPGTKYLITLE